MSYLMSVLKIAYNYDGLVQIVILNIPFCEIQHSAGLIEWNRIQILTKLWPLKIQTSVPDIKLDGPMIQSLKKVIKTDMKLSLHLETFFFYFK